ncbi:MAG: tRNA pseudouridine(13) synthase TruD [Gammaproteobacteria bacterium]|nr:tRNA pseudouridine(13) synthase TruD [Gammaproteobacteria bacterium]
MNEAIPPIESYALPDWAYGGGRPALRAKLRAAPGDFRVDEILPFELSGAGEHVWLHLEKTGMNTEFLAKALARFAGVKSFDVGYAGLKDRHAVTRQWFSVLMTGKAEPDWSALPKQFRPGELSVLAVVRHGRKLKTGALKENRFVLRLTGLQGDAPAFEQRLARVAAEGVPNYFGPQRFGLGGGNLVGAQRLFAGERPREQQLRGLYLSAARSFVFNQVLSTRVARGDWNRILPGEAVMLDGANSWFMAEAGDPALPERLARFDIHPSGPLWGEGESPARDEALAVEQASLAGFQSWCEGLAAFGLRQERRPLRLKPRDLEAGVDGDVLNLAFGLPSGCFATTVLRELVDYCDVSGGGRD